MNVTYTEKARQWGEGFTRLQQVTTRLEEVAGPSASLVKAEWDRREDPKGRALYTLRLSDWSGAVSADFAPDELTSRDVRYRLIRLWGDLLQVRSHKQLQKLTSGTDQTEE
jgi:hypothetical protein